MLKVLWHWPKLTGLDLARRTFPDMEIIGAETEEEVTRYAPEIEVLISGLGAYQPWAAEIYKKSAKKLRWMQIRGAGVDTAARYGVPQGIVITNAPGMSVAPISEHVIAMMLNLARRLHEWNGVQRRRSWERKPEIVQNMASLYGKTIVVVGFGSNAQGLCQRLKAFDLRIIVVSRAAEPGPTVDEVFRRDRLHEALAQADHVVMCTELTSETHHMLGRAEFAKMKPSAFVYNVGRGDLIDEDALIAALNSKTIAGAGLDVMHAEPTPPESPLWDCENLVMTPHSAARGGDDVGNFNKLLMEQFRRYRAGEPLLYVIDPAKLVVPS